MDFRGIVDQMFAVEGGDAKKERWLVVQRWCAHNKHSLPSVLEKAAEQGGQPPPLFPWLSEGGREERRWISRPREKERGTKEKEGERRLCKQMAFSSPPLRFLSRTTYGQKEGEMGGIEKKGKEIPSDVHSRPEAGWQSAVARFWLFIRIQYSIAPCSLVSYVCCMEAAKRRRRRSMMLLFWRLGATIGGTEG